MSPSRPLPDEVIETVLAFQEDGAAGPEKILVRLRPSGWWQLYVSAFEAFCEPLDQQDHGEVMRDYAETPCVDYGARFGLVGAIIRRMEVRRLHGDGVEDVGITMELDRGTATLAAEDPRDPHSDTRFAWTPSVTSASSRG